MMTKIYPRTGDKQTVYLNAVVKDPRIEVGDYTIYNDFVADPLLFEKNNVLYHYPIHCLRYEISVQLCQSYVEISVYLYISFILRRVGIEEIGHNGCMG